MTRDLAEGGVSYAVEWGKRGGFNKLTFLFRKTAAEVFCAGDLAMYCSLEPQLQEEQPGN